MMKPRTTLTLVSLLAMGVAWAGYDGIPQVDQTHINDRRDGKENDYYKPSMIDLRHLNDQPYDDPRPATVLEASANAKMFAAMLIRIVSAVDGSDNSSTRSTKTALIPSGSH